MDLVTGGGGYLGSHLVRALLERGRPVRILDLQRIPSCPTEAEFVAGDMTRAEQVGPAMVGVERVFHIAFVQSLSRRPEAERWKINFGGMQTLLQASLQAGVARFVFASTIEVYGTSPPLPCREDAPQDRPVGWYGRHKWACEQELWRVAAAHPELLCTALRMPTICGRGFYNHRPLLAMMDRILADQSIGVVGDGSTPGDFVLLEDVVQGFLLAGEREQARDRPFNISARAPSTQREVVEAMIAAVDSRSRIVRVPRPLVRLGLPLGRLLGIHDLPADQDGYLFHPNVYAVDAAREHLGYAPTASCAEAAAALITAYREDREFVKARSVSY